MLILSYAVGGYVKDVVSSSCDGLGGDAGGVLSCRVGRGPGEQYGKCLLGTVVGVPRCDVLIERWEGVVEFAASRGPQSAAITLVGQPARCAC